MNSSPSRRTILSSLALSTLSFGGCLGLTSGSSTESLHVRESDSNFSESEIIKFDGLTEENQELFLRALNDDGRTASIPEEIDSRVWGNTAQ